MASSRLCSIPNCGKPVLARGWCRSHYWRWHSHGNPLSGGTYLGAPQRWINDHLTYNGDDCLIWPFSRGGRGDALISYEGRQISAPRLLCTMVHGEPPTPKHDAAHSCGNGHNACMNQNHLRWATRAENMADKIEHGTAQRGSNASGAILSANDVLSIRSLRGQMTSREIAQKFGVKRRTVQAIFDREIWAWL